MGGERLGADGQDLPAVGVIQQKWGRVSGRITAGTPGPLAGGLVVRNDRRFARAAGAHDHVLADHEWRANGAVARGLSFVVGQDVRSPTDLAGFAIQTVENSGGAQRKDQGTVDRGRGARAVARAGIAIVGRVAMHPSLRAGLAIVADDALVVVTLLLCDRLVAGHGHRAPSRSHGMPPNESGLVARPISR